MQPVSPIKCESCRHHGSSTRDVTPKLGPHVPHGNFAVVRVAVFCTNDACASDEVKEMFPDRKGTPLDMAREICDREHNGHFVYFEPRDPSAGVTFRDADRERPPAPIKFRFADDEDRKLLAMAVGGAR
jgi:hypothetical protein